VKMPALNLTNSTPEAMQQQAANVFTRAYNQAFQSAVQNYQGVVSLLFFSCLVYTVLTAYLNRNPEKWDQKIFRIMERTNWSLIFVCSAYLFVSLFIKPLW